MPTTFDVYHEDCHFISTIQLSIYYRCLHLLLKGWSYDSMSGFVVSLSSVSVFNITPKTLQLMKYVKDHIAIFVSINKSNSKFTIDILKNNFLIMSYCLQ